MVEERYLTSRTMTCGFFLVPLLLLIAGLVSCRGNQDVEKGNETNTSQNRNSSPDTAEPTKPSDAGESPDATIWRHVETLTFDWNGNGQPDQLIMEIPKDWEDPAVFTRVRFVMDGKESLAVVNEDGWVPYEEDVGEKIPLIPNLIESDNALLIRVHTDEQQPPVLLLFGFAYASNPGSLHIFSLQDQTVRRVFFEDTFYLTDVADLNGDGVDEFIGKADFSQVFGPNLTHYRPYLVYELPKESGSATISVDMSREYNLKYYYGWAGLDYSEFPVVVLKPPDGGKPRILPEKEAYKLFGQEPPNRNRPRH